ncbi:MAG: DnaJ domain-containing protein [Bacteroidetes bacterium]|nr:DnaJ domain-containing protein [Bacteroidota bacterium]
MTPSEVKKYFDVLEIPFGSSLADAQKAYRELINVWHPDRFQGNENLRRKAEERTKRINEAYGFVKSFIEEYANQQSHQRQSNRDAHGRQTTDPPRNAGQTRTEPPPPQPPPKRDASKQAKAARNRKLLLWFLGILVFGSILKRMGYDTTSHPNTDTASHGRLPTGDDSINSSKTRQSSTQPNLPAPILSNTFMALDGTSDIFELTNVTGKITFKPREDNGLLQMRSKSNGKLLSKTLIPYYLDVHSVYRVFLDGGEYLIWDGCYPHRCPDERGLVIYSAPLNKFFRVHYIAAEDSHNATLDGNALPTGKAYVNFPLGTLPHEVERQILEHFKLDDATVVSGRLCSEYFCDGGSDGPVFKNPVDTASVGAELAAFGLWYAVPYSRARRILMQDGWKPVYELRDNRPYQEYPEVVCGNASCSVVYMKGDKRISLSLDLSDLGVDGVDTL